MRKVCFVWKCEEPPAWTIWTIAVQSFVDATEDSSNKEDVIHFDELSYFPSLEKYRNRGRFEKDKHLRQKDKEQYDICQKKYLGHPSLLPGIFTLFCPHGICYGFQVMESNESPNVPFTIMRSRFKKAPKHVIYDNACKLQDYCLNRDPCFFSTYRILCRPSSLGQPYQLQYIIQPLSISTAEWYQQPSEWTSQCRTKKNKSSAIIHDR